MDHCWETKAQLFNIVTSAIRIAAVLFSFMEMAMPTRVRGVRFPLT